MVCSVMPGISVVPVEVRRIDTATQQPTTRDERGLEGRESHTASAALCFSVVALVFVAGMALLASGLHWWGLCLVGAALLLLVSLCLLPAGRGQRPLDRHGSLQGRRVTFVGEPVPVSTCAHLRTISGNVVPYQLEEMTLADVSRMYPPPFPPPPYQAKANDARKQ